MEQQSELEQPKSESPLPEPRLSQKTFRSTPYRASDWEIVGERLERAFAPLELAIIRTEAAKIDPMFEDFAEGKGSTATKQWHSGTGEGGVPKDAVPAAPVIDEAVIAARVAKAFEEGKAAGAAEAEAGIRAAAGDEIAEAKRRAAALEESVSAEIGRITAEIEQRAFELSLSVARKILETTANAKPEYIYDVIRHALAASAGGAIVRIRISPVDWEFLKLEGLPEDLASEELRGKFAADDTIQSGCILETDFGEIDLRLNEMWEQVREGLFEAVR
jgi:flagellar biosynthesis/type III secretory pathway protein FliH